MEEAVNKLKGLLRTLFQFDCADLDFGIYRIMNYKREAIERFIEKDLIEAVSTELNRGILAQQTKAASELQQVAKQIREALGNGALDDDGRLVETYHNTPLGRRYQELQAQATGAKTRNALETLIFNHLYTFFSRYYDNGDFISKRRYSKQQKYAIPYNGEEVYLYWANNDQYYIKTTEYFNDYRFQAPNGVAVHFKLQEAQVEKDNNKGDKRFFFPRTAESSFNPQTREIVIPFEFRPLTEQEKIKYGTRNHQQETIIAEALEEIPAHFKNEKDALIALMAERRLAADGRSISYLEHHLRQYTRRNTSDFFIHKDLKGFLMRELDFYLKNEVLNLDDLEAPGKTRAEGWFQVMRVIRAIGTRIITFLAQIENFQKKLFEKKKFITETQYCITIGNIGEAFYKEIATNDAQWQEWKELFHIDEEEQSLFTATLATREEKRVAFLKTHPTLVLDTKHFDRDFVDRLLASFEDFDDQIDGLLVNSENFQALNLLLEKYRVKVKCIYIDPPYNTSASEILYKNDYKHSSWLAMMHDRLQISEKFMGSEAIICIAIDDYEFPLLAEELRNIFGETNHLATIVVRSNPHGRAMASGFSPNHEYALFFSKTDQATVGRLPRDERRQARYPESDEHGIFAWVNFRATGANSRRIDRPKLFYPIFVSKNGSIRVPSMIWSENEQKWEPIDEPGPDESIILPLDSDKNERVWNLGWERAQEEAPVNLMAKFVDGEWQIYRKYRPNQEGALPGTWWEDAKYSATESGTRVIKDLLGEREIFSYPKSIYLVEDCLRASRCSDGTLTLDFFAGSGTTAHAVINLNREDGGKRKFILVEMGEYFDTVLLPRIKKVIFTPKWKNGKPERMSTDEEAARSPRIIKYIRLESYDDSLNNISFTSSVEQQVWEFDDYLLKYMLDWETKDCETFLNIEKLASPFNYKLTLIDGQETKIKPVDLPETFNYLIGIHVTSRRVYQDGGRRYLVYRGVIDHRRVAIIWRDTEGWGQEDYERDKDFVADLKLTEGADEIFVNGDSFIPRAKALDPLFKSRMFGGV
ncbi:site-specific DNA-methyltransferase [Neomoorella thermoacetica]|uniref:site-specific DNA-methyltransferase n=1 Tax=Neomoorella thermoacetica TaxID=1525 RepID=UPI0030CE7936